MPQFDTAKLDAVFNSLPGEGSVRDKLARALTEGWEAKARRTDLPKLAVLLQTRPIDLQTINKVELFTTRLGGHGSVSAQRGHFVANAASPNALATLLASSDLPPSDEAIDAFIDAATALGFSDDKGIAKPNNARILVSLLLSALWPEEFVDYQPEAWAEFASAIGWTGENPSKSSAAQIRWAANVATAVAQSGRFKEVCSDDHPQWSVAGLVWGWNSARKNAVKKPGPPSSSGQPKSTSTAGAVTIPSHPLNLILCGPPGTGKTYATYERAVLICDGKVPDDRKELMARYRVLRRAQRIQFVTFHASYGYEDFVEGIRPVLTEAEDASLSAGAVRYECRDGIFRTLCRAAESRVIGPSSAVALGGSQIWKVSLGDTWNASESTIYDDCISEGRIRIGYGDSLDYSACKDRSAILAQFQAARPTAPAHSFSVDAVHRLKNQIQIGDFIVVSNGNSNFRAVGRVSGPYEFEARADDTYCQTRSVAWLHKWTGDGQPVATISNKRFSQMTIYQLRSPVLRRDDLAAVLAPRAPKIENYVIVIDEINRGNISKIMGELITLIEPSKRQGGDDETSVQLPYSQESFSIPNNLYILGTMNTADRSISLMDFALRRRFEFETILPDFSLVKGEHSEVPGLDEVCDVFGKLNALIAAEKGRDFQIGHSYLFDAIGGIVTEKTAAVSPLHGAVGKVLRTQIVPLLLEYFYEDLHSMQKLLGRTLVTPASKPPDDDDSQRLDLAPSLLDVNGAQDAQIYRELAKHLSAKGAKD